VTGVIVQATGGYDAQFMQPGERQFHLGLDTARSRDAATRRLCRQIWKGRGLATARFAMEHERPAFALANTRHQLIEHGAFCATTRQRRRGHPAPSSENPARRRTPRQ
jgi:hypothetical protein